MKASVAMDKAGRIVLPHQVRRQFHLAAGDPLDLKITTDGIFLRPRSPPTGLIEVNGLLVHEGEPAGELAQAVELSRSGRDADLLGWR